MPQTDPHGAVTVLASSVTAVCASALPFSVAPVFSTIAVWHNMIPEKLDVVPRVAWPATCQNMLLALQPPLRVTMGAVAHSEVSRAAETD